MRALALAAMVLMVVCAGEASSAEGVVKIKSKENAKSFSTPTVTYVTVSDVKGGAKWVDLSFTDPNSNNKVSLGTWKVQPGTIKLWVETEKKEVEMVELDTTKIKKGDVLAVRLPDGKIPNDKVLGIILPGKYFKETPKE